MKLTISSGVLLKRLSIIGGVVSNSPIVPVTENFLFELEGTELTVTGTDLHTIMRTRIEVMGQGDGKALIQAKLLLDTLKSLPEQPVTITTKSDFTTELATSNGRFKLAGENPLDFPKTPEVKEGKQIEFTGESLLNGISNTLYATSSDELRPSMSGINLSINGKATFAATDGHRLIRYNQEGIAHDQEFSVILPKKSCALLKSNLKPTDQVKAEFSSNHASFTFDTTEMITRLIDERYPDYENAIPRDNPFKLVVNKFDLLGSLKRIINYSNKGTNQIRFILSDSVNVKAENLEFNNEASEQVKAEYVGERLEIGFNGKFLIEMLGSLNTEQIEMELSAPNRAVVFRPVKQEESEDLLLLLMPVMLNN